MFLTSLQSQKIRPQKSRSKHFNLTLTFIHLAMTRVGVFWMFID